MRWRLMGEAVVESYGNESSTQEWKDEVEESDERDADVNEISWLALRKEGTTQRQVRNLEAKLQIIFNYWSVRCTDAKT